MQIFIYCKVTLHVSGVTAPIVRSAKNCNRNLRRECCEFLILLKEESVFVKTEFSLIILAIFGQYGPTGPRWREVAVPIL